MKEISPYRTYPVRIFKNSKGINRIGVKTASSIKKAQKAIYMFQSTYTGKCLIGATKNLQNRVYQYHTDINNEKKENEFLNDII